MKGLVLLLVGNIYRNFRAENSILSFSSSEMNNLLFEKVSEMGCNPERFLLNSKSLLREEFGFLWHFSSLKVLVGIAFPLTSISTAVARFSVFVHARQPGHVHGTVIEYLAILEKMVTFSPATNV
ncbi:hypothetical protein CEXT_525981 [Caerostris extrusa]|uniref:Uncharacterized protein n=1 Tax=Caerostris extrusa TaxID=172846 RepID=A0AAV4WJ90_CAEEX|nr:hypothetical protein CEXT_525981 [Caerostris extrusa]